MDEDIGSGKQTLPNPTSLYMDSEALSSVPHASHSNPNSHQQMNNQTRDEVGSFYIVNTTMVYTDHLCN